MGLRSGERDHILELITKLAYARSEEEYHEHYTPLLSTNLQSVITNWHCIRHEWVEAYKSVSFTLGEGTNNCIKSINSKIKSVCSRFGSLSRFFDQFFAVLAVLRNERDHHTLMALVKKAILPADIPDSTDIGLLTSYACHYVSKQLAFRKMLPL